MLVKLLLATVAIAGVAPATASADHVSCRVGHYLPGIERGTPAATHLRAYNLPRRTDGYAPRCLVAEAIVSEIQIEYSEESGPPARLRVFGARWSAGRWRCSYPPGRAVCRKLGKPHRRVTMELRT
jgi:hypothetical protein